MSNEPRFFVWRRGLRGPTASKDAMDPRQSIDWKLREQETIAIIPLTPPYDTFALASLIVTYPCPEVADT